MLSFGHWYFNASTLRELLGFVVTSVSVTDDSHAWIRGQDALDSLGHHLTAISNGYLTCMKRVADSDASSVVDRDPGRACGCVHEGIQQRPICNCVGSVFHAFGLAEWRCDRAAIEVIATDYDRRFDLALSYQLIHRKTELRALAISQPADASGQSLKLDALACEVDPAAQDAVFREEFEDEIVSDVNVRRFSG